MKKRRGERWDRIVVECSGVAEPQNIIDKFQNMQRANAPLMREVALQVGTPHCYSTTAPTLLYS